MTRLGYLFSIYPILTCGNQLNLFNVDKIFLEYYRFYRDIISESDLTMVFYYAAFLIGFTTFLCFYLFMTILYTYYKICIFKFSIIQFIISATVVTVPIMYYFFNRRKTLEGKAHTTSSFTYTSLVAILYFLYGLFSLLYVMYYLKFSS